MEQRIGNQQDYCLSNEQIQVLLTSPFGDGCISMQASGRSKYSTNCINEEYIDFKMKLSYGIGALGKDYACAIIYIFFCNNLDRHCLHPIHQYLGYFVGVFSMRNG